jgi:dipeptidase D
MRQLHNLIDVREISVHAFEDLNCFRFYQYFRQICSIPRGSGDEKNVSDWLVQFAREHGLACWQDGALNVVIKKNAFLGYEKAEPVILQAHMDMVCEKTPGSGHDFSKDAIVPFEENGYIRASGTTLGADDAVGMAYILAILEDQNIPHPKIEAVFTTKEEVGMEGMSALDASTLQSTRMINLDADQEGVIFASCSGGTRISMEVPADREPISGMYAHKLQVIGLSGGHSGIDINRNRANAIILLARALALLGKKIDLRVSDLSGGSKTNAIPRDASAIIWLNDRDIPTAVSEIGRIEEIFSAEYQVSEPGLRLSVADCNSSVAEVFTGQARHDILAAAALLPCGVLGFSQHLKDAPDSSCNLGIMETNRENVVFSLLARSNTNSKMDCITDQIESLGKILRARVKISSSYPAWEFRSNSALRDLCAHRIRAFWGRNPVISSIHGGLECALMTLKKPGIDMISFGPTILDAHTTNERVEIASMIHTWELLAGILGDMRN